MRILRKKKFVNIREEIQVINLLFLNSGLIIPHFIRFVNTYFEIILKHPILTVKRKCGKIKETI